MARKKLRMAQLKKLTASKSFVPQSSSLKRGDKGDDVKRLQEYLTKFGYTESPLTEAFGSEKARVAAPPEQDGNFDENTRQALSRFQKFNGLKVTGKMDKATLELMSRPRCGFPDTARFVAEGRKWDKTALTYSYSNFTPDLTQAQVRTALSKAFTLWAIVSPLTFAEVNSGADIVIRFVAGNHGDGSPFDGVSGVLAHAFYPPPNGGALAGDLHFDEAETWTINTPPTGIDLVTVAAHEIGHALGLAHSNVTGALMFAFYGGAHRNLESDDVSGIQSVYGAINRQSNWRWCNKCQGMWFAGNPTSGRCPAGGAHVRTGSGNYSPAHNSPAAPGQNDWRWCNKCQGMWFAGNPTSGRCPAGGTHVKTGSGNYTLAHNSPAAPGQSNWRWCNKCQGLWFAGNPTTGKCPAGGGHVSTGSGNYTVLQV
jgi:peptidoglycan hydrolase-like protein with peptidoglycan-binding domain